MQQNTTPQAGERTQKHEPEIVGRKFESEHYVVQSRRVNSDNQKWFAAGQYVSEAAARLAIKQSGGAINLGGGFCVSFQGDPEAYEYRIKFVKCENEIILTEFRNL